MGALDKIFWAIFIIVGIAIALSTSISIPILDVLLGLAVVLIGVQKLVEDYRNKEVSEEQKRMKESLDSISKWVRESNDFAGTIKTATESQFSDFSKAHDVISQKIEMNYRELARKILEIENRLNEISRVFVKQEVVRSGRRAKLK